MIAPNRKREWVATYDYHDGDGALLYQVLRFYPKRFVLQRPDGAGRYINNLDGVERVPYRLHELKRRIALNDTVFVVEGEKDADALWALGLCATTNAQGASWKWPPAFIANFRAATRIVVIADCDEGDPGKGTRKGREAARERASLLRTIVDDVRLLDLAPEYHDGYDVSDWLSEGHTGEELMALADAESPISLATQISPTDSITVTTIAWEDARPWPTLNEDALHGLAGDFVRLVAPHSEADLSALLSQFLCAFGCAIGANAHVMVEATPHTGRLNVLVIGATAGGRKGTAKDQVMRAFRIADEAWLEGSQISGLASGEGLIARLKDRDDSEPVEKRVLVVEPEFARTLAAGSRDGSILGAIIRDAWDSGRLQNLTRKEPLIAKGCHVCIIGHITADELRAKLCSTDIANGFFNRFIPICVKRRQRLPHGGTLTNAELAPLARRLRTALDFGRQVGGMSRTAGANAAWESFYAAVPDPQGLLGAVTARAEAQVLRMSLLYALLDGSSVIAVPHLRAAEALWNYAHASAEHVFGSTLGDGVADRVLETLRTAYPGSCDRAELYAIFQRHITAGRLKIAIDYLVRCGLASSEQVKTDGRPEVRVRAVKRELSEKSELSPPKGTLNSLNSLNSQVLEQTIGYPPPDARWAGKPTISAPSPLECSEKSSPQSGVFELDSRSSLSHADAQNEGRSADQTRVIGCEESPARDESETIGAPLSSHVVNHVNGQSEAKNNTRDSDSAIGDDCTFLVGPADAMKCRRCGVPRLEHLARKAPP